jgi:Flp pilus assembly protein TadG
LLSLLLSHLCRDERGAISILGALSLTALVGCAALVLEYGYGLLQRVEIQRAADVAAYAGAVVYNSTSSSTSANSAVANVATLNGLSGDATSSVGSSPTGNGNNAVKVDITANLTLALAKVLTNASTLPVSGESYAEISPGNAATCILALGGSGSGISLSGTGSIIADSCKVASNSTICANSGDNPSDVITTKNLSYGSGANPTSSSCTISPPTGTPSVRVSHATTADPLSGNTEVSGATTRLSTVSSITSPSAPTPGTNFTFGYSAVTGLPAGCVDSFASSTHTVTCSGSGPFTFGTITLSGGITVNLTTSTSAAVFNITGISMGGGSTGAFGAGTYNMGTVTCSGTSGYSICNTGTSLTFTGPTKLVLAGGIYNGGGASLAIGSGSSSNSYNIGKASDGASINVGTSKIMTFGDATGSGALFQTGGNITSGGGSCLTLPTIGQHDVNGNINAAGGIVMGAGIYTITGYVALGNGGGGDVSNCPTSGTTTGLTALSVTLVVGGANTVSCGSITSAFCLGSGYSTVKLTAPTSTSTYGSSTAGLAVIGPQSSTNTAAAVFTSGATNTQVSGAFYFPNGDINMSGAATLHDTVDSGACLELIGSTITASAGTATGSTCSGLGSTSTTATVGLIQ